MAIIQARHNPGARLEAGNDVLAAAAGHDARSVLLVKSRLAVFAKTHAAFVAADARVGRDDEALRRQQETAGEADVVQDEAVFALAGALAGDGASRTQPFKTFGFEPPSTLVKMGYAAEAKTALRLAKAATKSKSASKRTVTVAKQLEKASLAVLKATAPLESLAEARRASIAKRDSLGLAWETAFAALKRGARAAEDDGGRGLYDALFRVTASRPKSKRATAPTAPAPAVSGTPPAN